MEKPVLSIITVVYNAPEALKKTIQSILVQTYGSFEYLVIDGGSNDGTLEVIRRHHSSIHAWISEKDRGIYHAMNKGAAMAKGEYVCFLNAGDVLVGPDTLQKVADKLKASGNPDILYGNILVETPEGSLKERISREPGNLQRMYFCHQSAFVRTAMQCRIPYDESHPMSADLKFFKQCHHEQARFVWMNLPVVIYDTKGISHTQRNKGLLDNVAVVRETDKGLEKWIFLLRLYFVIGWRILNGKK